MADANDDSLDLEDLLQVRVSKAAKDVIRELGKKAGLKPSSMARVLLYKAIGFSPGPAKGKKS
jgi:hypothetical protein